MTKPTDIAWLAGIIDGEGCLFFANRKDYVHRPSGANRKGLTRVEIRCDIRVCMSHHPTTERVTAIFRDLVDHPESVFHNLESRHKSRVRPLKNVVVSRRSAVHQILKAVSPFLFTKKMEASLCLMFLERARSDGRSHYRATEYDAMLAEFATELRHGRGEARVQEFLDQVIPSQAASGQSTTTGEAEGVETRGLSPNNNDPHECPAPHHQLALVREKI